MKENISNSTQAKGYLAIPYSANITFSQIMIQIGSLEIIEEVGKHDE